MNVLNRSGAFIFGNLLFLIYYLFVFDGGVSLFFAVGRPWALTLGFLLGSELYYWKKNDRYLYKFYPIDFFDRNFLIILIYINLAVFFSDILLHPVSIIIFVIILILNELRMRKVLRLSPLILGVFIIIFFAYEDLYNKRRIYKELKEILGEEAIVTD